MKVLFNGKKKSGTMIVTCTAKGYGSNGCGSILQISSKDIWCAYDDVNYLYFFKCPCCKQITEINEKIPSEILEVVKRPMIGEVICD